jgi:hypothetical protein
VRLAAQASGAPRNSLYQAALRLRAEGGHEPENDA